MNVADIAFVYSGLLSQQRVLVRGNRGILVKSSMDFSHGT